MADLFAASADHAHLEVLKAVPACDLMIHDDRGLRPVTAITG